MPAVAVPPRARRIVRRKRMLHKGWRPQRDGTAGDRHDSRDDPRRVLLHSGRARPFDSNGDDRGTRASAWPTPPPGPLLLRPAITGILARSTSAQLLTSTGLRRLEEST